MVLKPDKNDPKTGPIQMPFEIWANLSNFLMVEPFEIRTNFCLVFRRWVFRCLVYLNSVAAKSKINQIVDALLTLRNSTLKTKTKKCYFFHPTNIFFKWIQNGLTHRAETRGPNSILYHSAESFPEGRIPERQKNDSTKNNRANFFVLLPNFFFLMFLMHGKFFKIFN